MAMMDALPLCYLGGRSVLRLSGADTMDFLQNLVTNDIRLLSAEHPLYACMLTPQGRFLHDFFLSVDGDGVLLECEAARRQDLVKRLMMFKLRSKVVIDDLAGKLHVHVSGAARGDAFADPRLPALGYRFYADTVEIGAADDSVWRDFRIAHGVPEGTPDLEVEGDTVAHANLDHLHAVSWDKGCYLGQEITAMTQNRGVAKKRMVIVNGTGLQAASALTLGGQGVGDIRAVNTQGTQGLAVIKLAAVGQVLDTGAVAQLPNWLALESGS